ncbi:hypothetical protein [Bremerella sp. P1]|uniref:hypothetical protein n=1 Tax=Bremerella sp. P1 TaxID=3026424 RepID=UPI002367CA88|nr:hypothetical protein [Bremerella sp. P1]WDI43753.1 hypothetical protein PSR63_07305 [Bremerella sp. P1]
MMRVLFYLSLVLMCAPTCHVWGMDGTQGEKDNQATGEVIDQEQAISLQFTGGTLAKYLEYLRIGFPESKVINSIALTEDAQYVEMPEIQLRTTDVGAFELIRLVTPVEIKHGLDSDVITIHSPSSPAKTVEVVNIKPILLAGESAMMSLLESIEMGIQLRDSNTPLNVKFHEGSGLLFLEGSASDINLAKECVKQMSASVESEHVHLLEQSHSEDS